MQPLYIFDLDGTIALNEHRQHFLKKDPMDWDNFYLSCIDDKPNIPVIQTMKGLSIVGADIKIFSGRGEIAYRLTLAWLIKYNLLDMISTILMRKENDYTKDEDLKKQWYNELSEKDKLRLVAVFEDRAKVVAMWRNIGVACFQVAEGSF